MNTAGAAAATVASAADVQLTAAQALIMTGTDMHTVDAGWVHMAIDDFIRPTLGGEYTGVPVQTPEEFWPFGGLTDTFIDNSIAAGGVVLDSALADALSRQAQSGDPDASLTVFGYSQSAVISMRLKQRLTDASADGADTPALTFVVIGNPTRPNGGIYARFAGLQLPGWTMTGAAPTDTPFHTIDIARQYDFFADFPEDSSNVLAVANAAMGAIYAHGYGTVTLDPSDPRYNPATVVQTYGDTTYYFIPAEHLPLLQPFWDAGVSPEQLAVIEPTLRALIEQGYDRSIPFGQPTAVTPTAAAESPAVRATLTAGLRSIATPAAATTVGHAPAAVLNPTHPARSRAHAAERPAAVGRSEAARR